MSLRSVFAVALLLAAVAAAQWSDVVLAVVANMSTVRVCAVDAPWSCINTVVLNVTIDPLRTIVLATDYSAATALIPSPYTIFIDPPGDGDVDVSVYVPYPGYVFHGADIFRVGGVAPERMRLCGRDVYAVRVDAGRYDVTIYDAWVTLGSPLWLATADCNAVLMLVANLRYTAGLRRNWAYVVLFYMPTAHARRGWDPTVLNGTQHAYFVRLGIDTRIVAVGYYVANKTLPTFAYYDTRDVNSEGAYVYKFAVGPRAYDAYSYSPLGPTTYTTYRRSLNVYNIGPTPGDGVAVVITPATLYGAAEVGWLSNDTGGYLRVVNSSLFADGWLQIRARRYALVEVAVNDSIYNYSTRTIACPPYAETTARVFDTVLTRLDRAKEIELCNNMTSTVYAALVYATGSYAFIDEIQPGRCRRLRWDGAYGAEQTALEFYTSPQSLCRLQRAAVRRGGQDYVAGWRYYITGNYSLVRGNPIDPDVLYAELWKLIMRYLANLHNATLNALWQWLQMQANATKKIEDYYRSLPHHVATIKIDSSTSVWLRTVLNVITGHAVSGPPPGGGFTPAVATSSITASAAAAAVATAWAASRRSLATAAFLAGFAILATALFVYYLYGAAVTAGLVLAAVALMSIGAAAAWFRKAED